MPLGKQANSGSPANNQSNTGAALGTSVSVCAEPALMVVVANYGRSNDVYLQRLLNEFRSMQLRLDVHVLTNIPKDLGHGVNVHVGLPTRDPRSLPFGHRQLFADNIERADYFLYCEDDTLISEANIRAFLDINSFLHDDEIPGFLRVERLSEGESYMESAHGPYRWQPESLVKRGPYIFAAFTNAHSAFTMSSRGQLHRALQSGGYLVGPHVGRFGMLESAASDLYTQCSMNRLICISRIEEFLVPHLSNANSLKWGLKYGEFLEQTRALQRIYREGGWKGSLLEVETRVPRGFWSKNLYERPDPQALARIPANVRTILSVGSGWGETEELLAKRGFEVTSLPVDGVFGDCQRRRGLKTLEGPFESSVAALQGRKFDLILMLDILHLVPEPVRWLQLLNPLLNNSGVLVATVPRTFDPLRAVWLFRGEPAAVLPRPFAESRIHCISRIRLRRWFRAAGFRPELQATCNTPTRLSMLMKTYGLADRMLADRFIVRATCQTAS
jgi:2-polyprenyl-3-methyl-5-hydroxy-6-metoxy-1,4-benzoquinol methylase